MASRRLFVAATSADVLANEEIREIVEASSVSLWASSVTEGDTLGLQLGRTILMDEGRCNVEAGTGIIDTDRDQLIFGTLVGPGTLRIPVTLTTNMDILIVVEPLV